MWITVKRHHFDECHFFSYMTLLIRQMKMNALDLKKKIIFWMKEGNDLYSHGIVFKGKILLWRNINFTEAKNWERYWVDRYISKIFIFCN